MSTIDREILRQLSILQSELARYLGTSRQAVCAGIKQGKDYLDSRRLLQLYDALHANGDRRATLVANRLKNIYGLEANPPTLTSTMHGDPESFPQRFEEMWVLGDELLELTSPHYATRMQKHYESPKKTLLYFVSRPEIGDRLTQRIKLEVGRHKRSGQQTAKICILLCNAVMFMPHLMIFDPISNEAEGYVRTSRGFVKMDQVLTSIMVANFTVAGVRPFGKEGAILANDAGFGGVSFKILHQF